MSLPDASAGPPHRGPLTDDLLRSMGPGEVTDSMVPQLRARCGRGSSRVVSFRVYYWSKAVGRPQTFTIGRWAPEVGGRRAGVSIAAARKKAAEILAQAQLGQDPQQAKAEARREVTVRRARVSVRDLCALVLRRLKPSLRAKTMEQYEGVLRLHVEPQLGDKDARRVTRLDVRALLDRLAARHPTTAVKTLVALRRVYSAGMELEIVPSSPCAGLKAPARLQPRDRTYSAEEVGKIWRGLVGIEAGSQPAPAGVVSAAQLRAHARVYQLALLLGCRRMEAYAARATEVDLAARIWRIPASRSKSKREHLLPLAPLAEALVRRALAEAEGGWLFPDRDPDPSRERGHVRPATKVDPVMRAACEVADLRLHDLRRTAADVMLHTLDVGPYVVEVGILGHRAPGLLPVYAPSQGLAATRAALEAWESWLVARAAG